MVTIIPSHNIFSNQFTMKNIIFSIALAFQPIIWTNLLAPKYGIEPRKLNSRYETGRLEIISCPTCNAKIYFITLQKNCCKKTVQVMVKNNDTGAMITKEILNLATDAVLPDGCSFACEYLPVYN